MQPWYERALGQNGRTSVGSSGLDLDTIAKLIGELFEPEMPPSPRADLPLSDAIRLSVEDIKAFYFEASSAQPGNASAAELSRWFWNDTQASDILREVGERLCVQDDPGLQLTGAVFVVPRSET